MFNWLYRIVGKNIEKKLDLKEGNLNETHTKWYKSKAVWTSIVTVIVGAIQPISTSIGHPIEVPNWILEILVGLGLYTLRTASKPIG